MIPSPTNCIFCEKNLVDDPSPSTHICQTCFDAIRSDKMEARKLDEVIPIHFDCSMATGACTDCPFGDGESEVQGDET